MSPTELRKLLPGGESERVEFKGSTGQRTEAAKTVCAMLNGLGGFVVFGVTNSGELIGQQVGVKTLEDVASELRRIEPPAFPDVETINLKRGNAAVLLTVPGGGGPYTFDGRAYLRHGPTTRVMPRAEYERRLVERLHATRRWENEPVTDGVTVKDLDAEEIRITLDNAIRLGRLEPTGRRDLESILRGLELIRDGRLLNAAVALYGKSDRLRTMYPQMGIRLALSRQGSIGRFCRQPAILGACLCSSSPRRILSDGSRAHCRTGHPRQDGTRGQALISAPGDPGSLGQCLLP
jgi:ATP-dependent DNA helicase RecG